MKTHAFGPVLTKRVRGPQEHIYPSCRKSTPLPIKQLEKDLEDEDYYGCPILKETPTDEHVAVASN